MGCSTIGRKHYRELCEIIYRVILNMCAKIATERFLLKNVNLDSAGRFERAVY
jgi:hypothetical protein